MSYYRGDYYRGDYYRGDFLGIGKAVKKVGSLIGGAVRVGAAFATGGPLAAGRAGIQMLAPKNAALQPALGRPMISPGNQYGLINFGGGGISGGGSVTKSVKGNIDVYGHLGGSRRRMNVTNVRALRRAGRRVKGFLKLARRLGALPVGTSGKKLFKAHRRRK